MPIEILMPALSPTMTEGNLAKWVKKEGDAVHSGDVLAEIETDKATMEVEAVDDGRVGKILVPEGTQGVKVNQPIALLLGEGEDPSALTTFAASVAKPVPTAAPGETEPQPAPAASAAAVVPATARPNGNGRIFASPLARRMAQQAGLDLAAIIGSGPQGRIVKADIEAALSTARTAPATALPAARPDRRAGNTFADTACRARLVERAGGGIGRQPALYRAAPQRDAPGHRPAADRVEADRPAFLSDDRLRDRRTAEDSRRAERQIRCLPDFCQRFCDPRGGPRLAPGAGGQCVVERRGDPLLGIRSTSPSRWRLTTV